MITKLEVGKYYKTRDGRKVGPIQYGQEPDEDGTTAPWPYKSGAFWYKENGYSCPGIADHHQDQDDIVSEWHDTKSSSIEETLVQRQKKSGNFSDHARICQELKGCLIPVDKELTDVQRESLDMICHKIARILSGDANEPDHWHDIAGYATLVEKELTKEN